VSIVRVMFVPFSAIGQVGLLEDDVLRRGLAEAFLELLLHLRRGGGQGVGVLRELLFHLTDLLLGRRPDAHDLAVRARLDRAGAVADGLLEAADLASASSSICCMTRSRWCSSMCVTT
jgi:hypothetical protein